jgi:hypothetical protein
MHPAEIWRTRVDVLMSMIHWRARLIERARRENAGGRGAGRGAHEDGAVEYRPDGTKVTHLTSMDSLRALLKGGVK